ncbi:hypothetical protein EZY14_017130 [Kordia sp. TARA_039_SRF]|nr:hypothetical protein EZY14_017130 [Kordia sp. TARA_039_SRF]
MISKENIYIVDIISILIFSLLGNYLIGLEINFSYKIDFLIIVKIIFLCFSAFSLNRIAVELKKIQSQAEKEYYGYQDLKERATKSIDEIYSSSYKSHKKIINIRLILSIISAIMFFFIDALIIL